MYIKVYSMMAKIIFYIQIPQITIVIKSILEPKYLFRDRYTYI